MPINLISIRSFLDLVNIPEGVNQLHIPGTAAGRMGEHERAQRHQQVELYSDAHQPRYLQPGLRAEIANRIQGGELASRHIEGLAWLPRTHPLIPRLTMQSLSGLMQLAPSRRSSFYIVSTDVHPPPRVEQNNTVRAVDDRAVRLTSFEDHIGRVFGIFDFAVQAALLSTMTQMEETSESLVITAIEERRLVVGDRRGDVFARLSGSMTIERGDELRAIIQYSLNEAKKPMGRIQYRGESGLDQGGLTRSAFDDAYQQLRQKRFFEVDAQGFYSISSLDYFAQDPISGAILEFIGVGHFIARTIEAHYYHNVVTAIPFANTFYEELYELARWLVKGERYSPVQWLVNDWLTGVCIARQENSFRAVLSRPDSFADLQRLISVAHLGISTEQDSQWLACKATPWIARLDCPIDATIFLEKMVQFYYCESLTDAQKILGSQLIPKLALSQGYFEVVNAMPLSVQPKSAIELKTMINQPISIGAELVEAKSKEDFFDQRFEVLKIPTTHLVYYDAIIHNCMNYLCRFFRPEKNSANDACYLSSQQRIDYFFKFVTGSSTLHSKTKIKIQLLVNDVRYLPVAHTCTTQLDISIHYFMSNSDYKLFEEKLMTAITETEGFDIL